ncbi:MAG: hypothetical protein ACLQVY_07020 [Limisphaerales bacterium]
MADDSEEEEWTLTQLLKFAAEDMATKLRRKLLKHPGELIQQFQQHFIGPFGD